MNELSTNLFQLLGFAAIALTFYKLTKDKYKDYALLAFNIIFYYLCSSKYLIIMLLSSIWAYFMALYIPNAKNRKIQLALGIIPVAGILCTFKYWNSFMLIFANKGGG